MHRNARIVNMSPSSLNSDIIDLLPTTRVCRDFEDIVDMTREAKLDGTYPTTRIYKKDSHINTNEKCSICLEKFKLNEECIILKLCNHGFHKDCVGGWLKQHNSCPLCRQPAHQNN